MNVNAAPYRFSSVTDNTGRQRLRVEVHGPLPDPLAGLTAAERSAVRATPRTWGEFILLAQTQYYPLLAREAVNHYLMSRRRTRYLARRAEQELTQAQEAEDQEPEMAGLG